MPAINQQLSSSQHSLRVRVTASCLYMTTTHNTNLLTVALTTKHSDSSTLNQNFISSQHYSSYNRLSTLAFYSFQLLRTVFFFLILPLHISSTVILHTKFDTNINTTMQSIQSTERQITIFNDQISKHSFLFSSVHLTCPSDICFKHTNHQIRPENHRCLDLLSKIILTAAHSDCCHVQTSLP